MTITEAIQSFPGLEDVPENYLTKVLIDRSVSDGSADYDLSQKGTVELCAADCYVAIVTSPGFNEGKLSIKISRGEMLSRARSLYLNNGGAANANKIAVGKGSAKANWW